MVLAGVGLVAGLVYLFTRNQDKVKGERSENENSEEVTTPITTKTNPKGLISLDD